MSDGEESRLHFKDFSTSLATVFYCMSGSWVNQMRTVVASHGKTAILFYFEIMVLGNFMLLNLFLAILLQNMDVIKEKVERELAERKLRNSVLKTTRAIALPFRSTINMQASETKSLVTSRPLMVTHS